MRHRLAGRHLGRDTAHRTALFRNLVTDLLRYERITTTEAKAKEIRPLAEKIITLGKRGNLHARRQALAFVYDQDVVSKVFDEIAGRMRERPGGYLRITAVEARKGDGARMASIELVDLAEPVAPAPRAARSTRSTALSPAERRRQPARPPAAAAAGAPPSAAAEAAADDIVETPGDDTSEDMEADLETAALATEEDVKDSDDGALAEADEEE